MSFRILAIGEVLWDVLPEGRVLGGAPANFAFHAHALGAQAALISRIGNDALGREILRQLQAAGLSADLITIDFEAPTGTVTVSLSADGQPCYTIHENVAWDRLTAAGPSLVAAAGADAICFGSLAQRSTSSGAAILQVASTAPPHALRVFDINLRQSFFTVERIEASLELANVLKLNDAELPVLAKLFALAGDSAAQLRALAERFSLQAIALTRGPSGSILLRGGELSEHAGIPVEVRDTIGAGDSFTAAFVLGLLGRWPLAAINQHANEVAAFVCSQPGATPVLPDELRAPYQNL